MLQVKAISKSYDNKLVLDRVSCHFELGKITAIVGVSGSGKSTLLQLLGTLDKPDSGEILFHDINPFNLSHKKLYSFRNQRIGFIFQFHHLLNEFTAFENVCMPAWFGNEKKEHYEQRASGLFKILDIYDYMGQKPNYLSGGEQQRVAIARALINQPSVVLADEPTGNLDQKNTEKIGNLFLKLNKELKQTFIMVTHNRALAEIADQIYELKNGHILKTT